MDERYFDAKFDGLEKLMTYQQNALNSHISAVSANVKTVARELAEHRESTAPHGRRATDRLAQNVVAWLGVAVASFVAALEFRKPH